jgi:hypothetical protein
MITGDMNVNDLIQSLCKIRSEVPGTTHVTIFGDPVSAVYIAKMPTNSGVMLTSSKSSPKSRIVCELDELIYMLIDMVFAWDANTDYHNGVYFNPYNLNSLVESKPIKLVELIDYRGKKEVVLKY